MSSSSNNQTIKVIGAGFGRTGTTSLRDALNILGFRCYHMQEVMHNRKPSHANLWIQAYEGKLTDYDLIFKSSSEEQSPYTATVDWPSTAVYTQLMQQYPDAKVILTVRDAESWYKSVKDTIYRVATEFPVRYIIPPSLRRMAFGLIWTGTFKDRFGTDKQFAIDLYNQHNVTVKQTVPKDRLLVLDFTSKGSRIEWEPLCEFLQVPLPPTGTPFPRSNETKEVESIIRRVKIISCSVIVVGSILIAVLSRRAFRRIM